MPESNKVRTRLVLPANTDFGFAGDGLDGSKGQLRVDAGAGFAFNEWGRLILNLKKDGGLGYDKEQLCINSCEVASNIAGIGLTVKDCKLAVTFQDVAGRGLKQNKRGRFTLDLTAVLGRGLKVEGREADDELAIDGGFAAQSVDDDRTIVVDVESLAGDGLTSTDGRTLSVDWSKIHIDLTVDPEQTASVSIVKDVSMRFAPSAYGYSCVLQLVKVMSTVTVFRNKNGVVVGIFESDPEEVTQDLDLGGCYGRVYSSPPQRESTPDSPNFYSN